MKYIKTFEGLVRGKSEEQAKNGLSEQELIKLYIKQGMFDKLPRNKQGVCVIDGDFNCSRNQLTSLPDNLTVNGNFYCDHNKLTILPDKLTVDGNLFCDYNNLTKLPESLTVGGKLFCSNQKSGIKLELPLIAIVKGDFYN